MKTITQLPNLASSFSRMKIQDMLGSIRGTGLFSDVIRQGALEKRDETIKMVQDQIKCNRLYMIDIIGEQCVILIEKL